MPESALLSKSIDDQTQRRDTFLAAVLAAVGLVAIIIAHGGIGNMIAGSVGSVGGGCLAVGLTFLDGRLSYSQRVQASVPIILMLAGVGLTIKDNALALAGYPLLLLGAAGLLPAILQWLKSAQKPVVRTEKPILHGAQSPALSST